MPESDQVQEVYFIELRWILLILINTLRPESSIFFSNDPMSLLKPTMLLMVVLLFLTVSSKTYVFKYDGALYLLIVPVISKDLWRIQDQRYRRCSFPITMALGLSIISPTPIFHCFLPFVPFLCLWPTIQTLIGRLCRHLRMTRIPFPHLQHQHRPVFEASYYYKLRWIVLPLIHHFFRDFLAFFFANHVISTQPQQLLKAFIIISMVSLAFLTTSLKLCLTGDDNENLNIVLRFSFRDGRSMPVTTAFIISLFCPTPVFKYLYPLCILPLSLWPSFSLNFLRRLFRRLQAALSAFITFSTPIIPPSPDPQQNEGDDAFIV